MAYSAFTLRDIEAKLGITLTDVPDMFAAVPDGRLGSAVESLLEVYLPLAISINTEKAKSELLIAPLLADVREQLHREVSLFSGVEFDVDVEKGLNGTCDFVFTRSRQQQFIKAPVVVIAEGKNDLPKLGFGQCIAGMVAAKVFNERAGTSIDPLYGCASTGLAWRFLRLTGSIVEIDEKEYHVPERTGKIIGILLHVLGSPSARSGQAA